MYRRHKKEGDHMVRCSSVLRAPTERTWSWAPYKKRREVADFAPLRVLFCGSDNFSVPTFDMLREMHLRRSDVVSRLGVITPVDKLSGRGLSIRKAAPMTLLANRMGFPVHHVHNFSLKSSELPEGEWDLIVAVSFGHKITPPVLDQMKVGGINIHPSLLPRYRGPAPLHHALLNGDRETGVTLQTIHPTEFDKGQIVMQSPAVQLEGTTLSGLYSATARIGASMLKELLLNGYPANAPPRLSPDYEESYAGKIQKNEMQIIWTTWTTAKIVRWSDVLDSLWTKLGDKIVKLHDLEAYPDLPNHSHETPGQLRWVQESISIDGSSRQCHALVVASQDGWLKIGRFTVAGKKERFGQDAADLNGARFND